MSLYRIADLLIGMEFRGKILDRQCKPYSAATGGEPCFKIKTTEEAINNIVGLNPRLSVDEAEYILTGAIFSSRLLNYNGFILHSSAISFENKAILFSAPSGAGKSTHTKLWQEYYGKERITVINDDKPAIRLLQDSFYVYGTPWSGKSDLSRNIKVPLKAICFIEKSENNYIYRLSDKEAVIMLIYQSLHTWNNKEKIDILLTLIEFLINEIEIYKIGCTVSKEAVKMVSDAIR